MERIDARRALELMTDLVDAYGEDYVYGRASSEGSPVQDDCRYEHNGVPSCLVGHVLHRAGVTISQLLDLDTRGTSPVEFSGMGLDVTQEAGQLLGRAQGMQDVGVPWGRCLQVARENYEGLSEEFEGVSE